MRLSFLNKARDYCQTIIIIKSGDGKEFGFFIPDIWENTEGKPKLHRDFYSPYLNCKEIKNG